VLCLLGCACGAVRAGLCLHGIVCAARSLTAPRACRHTHSVLAAREPAPAAPQPAAHPPRAVPPGVGAAHENGLPEQPIRAPNGAVGGQVDAWAGGRAWASAELAGWGGQQGLFQGMLCKPAFYKACLASMQPSLQTAGRASLAVPAAGWMPSCRPACLCTTPFTCIPQPPPLAHAHTRTHAHSATACRFACLFTSHVSNLIFYSPLKSYRGGSGGSSLHWPHTHHTLASLLPG